VRFEDDTRKPRSHRITYCAEIGAQAVVARHLHNGSTLAGRRNAERVSRSLHDERRDQHRIELGETALRGLGA
jgi:serine acetyltransferase